MSVEAELDKFGKRLVKQSRSNLTRRKKNASSKLYKSLRYEAKENKNSFEFSFYMEDYGDFVDKGVRGAKSSLKAPRSPYSFKKGGAKGGGLTRGISRWVRQRNIRFRNKKGQFITRDSTEFLIRRSVFNTGMFETKFYSRPFELAFKKLPEQLIEAYALEVDDFLKMATK